VRPHSAKRLSAPEDESTNVPGCGSEDRLAALITGLERPTAYHVAELLLSWRHAQQEATRAYARWHELSLRDGHAVYLAALDREERAAGVYAEVRRRAIEPSMSI
jgi:hypothetical protein